jgi:hypothetical protein
MEQPGRGSDNYVLNELSPGLLKMPNEPCRKVSLYKQYTICFCMAGKVLTYKKVEQILSNKRSNP